MWKNTEFWHVTLSWHSPIDPIKSDLITSSHGTAHWFSLVSVANELIAQYLNTWLLFAVAVCQHTSETLHLPQLHLYRSADSCMIYGVIHMCYMCSSSISYMLTAACCECIGSSMSQYLLCRSSSSSVTDLFRQDQIH